MHKPKASACRQLFNRHKIINTASYPANESNFNSPLSGRRGVGGEALIFFHHGKKVKTRMGHCPQSNHHRSYRHSGSFRSGRLQIAMRTITLLIVHCSATPQGVALGFEDCRRDHIHHRGFRDIGYHFYLTRNGEIHRGRPLEKIGAHCLNHNRHSIGICYEGGLDAASFPADTRTLEQKASLLALLRELKRIFPRALIVGHHDLNPTKACPCFDAEREYRGL